MSYVFAGHISKLGMRDRDEGGMRNVKLVDFHAALDQLLHLDNFVLQPLWRTALGHSKGEIQSKLSLEVRRVLPQIKPQVLFAMNMRIVFLPITEDGMVDFLAPAPEAPEWFPIIQDINFLEPLRK